MGPVVEYRLVARQYPDTAPARSNPLAVYSVKVPHCMKEQYSSAKLTVRRLNEDGFYVSTA